MAELNATIERLQRQLDDVRRSLVLERDRRMAHAESEAAAAAELDVHRRSTFRVNGLLRAAMVVQRAELATLRQQVL